MLYDSLFKPCEFLAFLALEMLSFVKVLLNRTLPQEHLSSSKSLLLEFNG